MLALLVNLAPLILERIERVGKAWLAETPIERAISETDRLFAEIECRPALEAWAASAEFEALLRLLGSGQNQTDTDSLVSGFIVVGGFQMEDELETRAAALQILDTFARQLWVHLLQSDQALVYSTQAIISRIDELGRGVNSRLALDDNAEKLSPAIQARLDTARSLILSGRISAARDILLELRSGQHGDLESQARFRVANNLGACALRSGDLVDARQEFTSALKEEPESSRAAANLALVDLVEGHTDAALGQLSKLWGIHDHESHLASVYLLGLGRAGKWNDIGALLQDEAVLMDDESCMVSLGEAYCEAGRFDDAVSILTKATREFPENSEAWVLFALATNEIAHEQLRREFVPEVAMPSDIEAALHSALEMLERAITLLEKEDPSSRLLDCYAGRAGLLAILGRDDEALRECDRVLSQDPTHPVALRNRALQLLGVSVEEAIPALELAISEDPALALICALGRALAETGKNEAGAKALEPLRSRALSDHEAVLVASELVHVYAALGEHDKAMEVSSWLDDRLPESGEARLVKAMTLTRPDDQDERISALREARALSEGKTQARATIELADALFEREEYSEAADLYGSIDEASMEQSLAQRLAASLFNGGRRLEALALARRLRNGGVPIPVITEIELLVLEEEDSVQAAFDLSVLIVELQPEKLMHRLRAADLAIRLHREDRALEIAEAIPEDLYSAAAVDLINVAVLRARLGMGGAIALAYKAHRFSPGDPEVESRFIGLVLNREGSAEEWAVADPQTVDLATTVTLDGPDGELLVAIESDEPGLLDHEVDPTDPLAERLMSHAVGDTVLLKDTTVERIEVTIKAIRNSWVAAFQIAIAGFSTRFPTHSAVSRISIEDDDLTPVFLAVEERHRLVSQLLEWYENRHFPLGALASMSGATVPEVWGGIISAKGQRLHSAGGSHEEQAHHASLLREQDGLVVELTALLTITSLGLEDQLVHGFPNLVIAQSTVDAIQSELERNYVGMRPSMSLGMEEGRFTRSEIEAEDIERGRAFFERTRDFAISRTTIQSSESGLAVEASERANLVAVLGRAGFFSALVASESGMPLVSDDMFYRGLAAERWGIDGVWTQALMRELLRRDVLSESEYQDALVRLCASGYWYLSVAADDFLGLLRRELALTPGFTRLLELIQGPTCTLESAVDIVSALVKGLYLESFLPSQRTLILDASLVNLITGRNPAHALQLLVRSMESRLILMPLAMDDASRSIAVWARQLGL